MTSVAEVRQLAAGIVDEARVFDMHTHLFPPAFTELTSWGIDDLLTYHYLAAELMRVADVSPEQYSGMPKTAKADLIWESLFVRNTPLSEAASGVVTVLHALGLNPCAPDLREARDYFRSVRPQAHLSSVLERSRVDAVVMTNDPFDPIEVRAWETGAEVDPRFKTALRIDPLVNDWKSATEWMTKAGRPDARKFLDAWIARFRPLYLAVSLPDTFSWPSDDERGRVIRDVILPTCREHRLPFAMMIGVRRRVNPALRDAGDAVGRADVTALHRLCAEYPENRFFVTMLSRENQHELCVAARKFANLMPFGCWWFLNNPSIVSEITRERLELLGPTFIAQHSDARILEQLLYKWPHAKREIAAALADRYAALAASGRAITADDIRRDVKNLFSGNFERFTAA